MILGLRQRFLKKKKTNCIIMLLALLGVIYFVNIIFLKYKFICSSVKCRYKQNEENINKSFFYICFEFV